MNAKQWNSMTENERLNHLFTIGYSQDGGEKICGYSWKNLADRDRKKLKPSSKSWIVALCVFALIMLASFASQAATIDLNKPDHAYDLALLVFVSIVFVVGLFLSVLGDRNDTE